MESGDLISRPDMSFEEKVADIKTQFKEAEREGGSSQAWEVFNNFFTNLPGGGRRNFPDDILEKSYESSHLGKSGKEFFADIDAIIKELDISVEEIERLQTEYNRKGSWDLLRDLFILTIPVYVKLREKGYTHHDLWG